MAISNYKLCNLAARSMRFAMRRLSYDPVAAPKPNVKEHVAAAAKQLAEEKEQDQPAVVTIDCGTF